MEREKKICPREKNGRERDVGERNIKKYRPAIGYHFYAL